MLIVPVFLLVLLPTWLVLRRVGWPRDGGRALLVLGTVTVVAVALPWGSGADLERLKRLDLFLAAGAALALALREPAFVSLGRERDRFASMLPLTGLAALALVAHVNFFQFHGQRTFVHMHDVAHYYLGSKYYGELGYTGLYTGMLRAESERYDDHFLAVEARDLESYERVHIATLLRKSEPVKQRFTPERWAEFTRDVAMFRDAFSERLGPELYGTILLDHGFNPTPVWALIGGGLAGLVPAGSERGLLVLALLDPLLLAAAALAVGWAFGRKVAALAVLYFCVVFGTSFGWTGGAFLRYLWFASLIGAVACMGRRRYGWAGVGFALATALRVFPVMFLVPIAAKGAWLLLTRGRLPRRYLRLFGAFAVTGALLLAATAALPRGFAHWGEFRDNMQTHMRNISPNVIGLTDALAFRVDAPAEVTQAEFNELKERRRAIRDAQLVVVFAPTLLGVCWLARRRRDLDALLLALPLLLTGLSLAAYYYAFLVIAVIARRRSPGDLALLFGLEAASHALRLFEDREALIHIYRSLALLELSLLLFLDPIRRELGAFRRWRARLAVGGTP